MHDKALVVPHPISFVEEVQAPCDRKRSVVFAGRLTKQKGVDTLLRAARILKTESPEVLEHLKIRIVGEYVSGENPSGYGDCVTYTADALTDEDLERELRTSLFVVLPYERSGYAYVTPGTLYRALGCGTPVIVTALPSVNFVAAKNPLIGYVVNDARELARVIRAVATQPIDEYRTLLNNVATFARSRSVTATADVLRRLLPLGRGVGGSEDARGHAQLLRPREQWRKNFVEDSDD